MTCSYPISKKFQGQYGLAGSNYRGGMEPEAPTADFNPLASSGEAGDFRPNLKVKRCLQVQGCLFRFDAAGTVELAAARPATDQGANDGADGDPDVHVARDVSRQGVRRKGKAVTHEDIPCFNRAYSMDSEMHTNIT